MKQWLVAGLILVALGVACSMSSNVGSQFATGTDLTSVPIESPRPEDNPAFRLLSEALQADDRAKQAEATAQVYRAVLTATQQESNAKATHTAAAQTSQAYDKMIASTQSSIGTATQQQFEIIGWTVTAAVARDTQQAQNDGTSTAVGATTTEEAHRIDRTADAQNKAVIATQTQVALNLLTAQESAQIQQIEDKKRTDAMISTAREILGAFAPWIGLLAAMVAIGFAMIKIFDMGGRVIRAWVQAKGIVQWLGGKPFFVHTGEDGSVTYVDMSKNPGPVVTVNAGGEVSNPIQVEDSVLQRSAAIEGLLAMGTGTNRGLSGGQNSRIAANLTGGQPQGGQQRLPFVIFTAEQSKLLPPGIRNSLDAAWQQSVEGEYREDDSSQKPASETEMQ